MEKIRVLLADDHNLVRAGIRALLESEGDIQVVGEATDGFQAIDKAKELLPDVAIMDITMPKLGGLEAARRIRKECPSVAILFLTMHEGEEYFFQALRVGATGYVPKSALDSEMLAGVRACKEGQTYLHPSVARSMVSDYLEKARGAGIPDPYESLTDREKETLHYVAGGYTNRQIAEAMHLSANTVHNHRTSLMEKLGMHNRMELLKYALRKGLISEEA